MIIDVLSLFANQLMQIIIILVVIDVLLGIVAALVKKNFIFTKLGNFMKKMMVGYVFGFVIVEIIGQSLQTMAFIVPSVFVIVVLALLASIVGNLGKLGLPVPAALKKE